MPFTVYIFITLRKNLVFLRLKRQCKMQRFHRGRDRKINEASELKKQCSKNSKDGSSLIIRITIKITIKLVQLKVKNFSTNHSNFFLDKFSIKLFTLENFTD